MTSDPLGYAARARRGDQVLAESTDARRRDPAEGPPELWFPREDVVADDPAARAGEGDLSGFVAFDPSSVELEVVDGRPGDDPRDVTVKRWPVWGDAADLVDLLDVRRGEDGSYTGGARGSHYRSVVEASQLLGQAIVAAGRHAPGRRVVSASMVFSRAGDAARPVPITLEELSHGRTFTTLAVQAAQDGRTCAHGLMLLDSTAPDLIRHAVSAPAVDGPYDAVPYDMMVTGRDLRFVDAAYTGDPDAPVGPPVIDAWVRYRDLPDDPVLHTAVMAQFTGHVSIAAALRPHAGIGQRDAHRTISTGINAISLSVHSEVRADQWLLYHHHSTFAGDGMVHSECRVHTQSGALVASFTVDAMVRGMATHAPTDARKAL